MKTPDFRLLVCSLPLLGLSASLWAQKPRPQTHSAPMVWQDHTVQPGDSLSRLVVEELVLPANKQQAMREWQKGNPGVSLTELRTGQNLRIPQPWVRPAQARVSRVACTGPRWPSVNDRPLRFGDTVSEGDTVDIPPACQIDFLFDDGTRLVLPSAARFKITTLRRDLQRKVPDVRIELLTGRVHAQVSKQRPKGAIFEVQTPGALTAVRGTDFQVGFVPESQTSLAEVLEGQVGNQGKQDAQSLVVARMQGVATNAQGQGQGVEALPEPPVLDRIEVPNAQTVQLHFKAAVQAKRYAFASAAAANTPGRIDAPLTELPSHALPMPANDLASLTTAQSLTASGLQGPERRLALCQNPLADLCKVLFDASAAGQNPVQLDMQVEIAGKREPYYQNMNLQFAEGKFVISSMSPGVYHWVLRYPMPAASPFEAPRLATESGSFELHVVKLPAATKP